MFATAPPNVRNRTPQCAQPQLPVRIRTTRVVCTPKRAVTGDDVICTSV